MSTIARASYIARMVLFGNFFFVTSLCCYARRDWSIYRAYRTLSRTHAMLKQEILPVSPLIQCEAGRAKTKLFVLLGLKMAAV